MLGPIFPIYHNNYDRCVELCGGCPRSDYSNYCFKNLLEYIMLTYHFKYYHNIRMSHSSLQFSKRQNIM
jgi:hypothetical protein